MSQKKSVGGRTMNLLFTMLLFLVFVLCALFTVLFGGRVYENIGVRMEENYSGSVALHYVANKVRQGDRAGLVRVVEIEGTPVLELAQEINDARYVTWIYYREGAIRELFTREDSRAYAGRRAGNHRVRRVCPLHGGGYAVGGNYRGRWGKPDARSQKRRIP